jgi:hypothetical protein
VTEVYLCATSVASQSLAESACCCPFLHHSFGRPPNPLGFLFGRQAGDAETRLQLKDADSQPSVARRAGATPFTMSTATNAEPHCGMPGSQRPGKLMCVCSWQFVDVQPRTVCVGGGLGHPPSVFALFRLEPPISCDGVATGRGSLSSSGSALQGIGIAGLAERRQNLGSSLPHSRNGEEVPGVARAHDRRHLRTGGREGQQTNPRRAVDLTWSAKARPEMR